MTTLEGEWSNGTACTSVRLRTGLYRNEVSGPVEIEPDPARSPQRHAEHPGVLQAARAAELAARPPLGRLVNRPGAALPLGLAALAVANFREEPGEAANVTGIPNTGGHSWAKIIGDPSMTAPVRRHIAAGLERLDGENLVTLRSMHGRGFQSYDGWELSAEDGSGDAYTVPLKGLQVPSAFWLQGWAAVLTGPEIATYMMLRDVAATLCGAHANQGIGVPPSRRRAEYGISKEVYATTSELEEFGLIRRTTVRRGDTPSDADPDTIRPREVQRFQVLDAALERPAYETVLEVLTNRRLPARIGQYDPMENFALAFGDLTTPAVSRTPSTASSPVPRP